MSRGPLKRPRPPKSIRIPSLTQTHTPSRIPYPTSHPRAPARGRRSKHSNDGPYPTDPGPERVSGERPAPEESPPPEPQTEPQTAPQAESPAEPTPTHPHPPALFPIPRSHSRKKFHTPSCLARQNNNACCSPILIYSSTPPPPAHRPIHQKTPAARPRQQKTGPRTCIRGPAIVQHKALSQIIQPHQSCRRLRGCSPGRTSSGRRRSRPGRCRARRQRCRRRGSGRSRSGT